MDKKGVIIDGTFYEFSALRENAEIYLTGEPLHCKAVIALLDHIEAQQGERQAFVAGAEWHANLTEGPYNAMTEAATRYPAARPMPTRADIERVLNENSGLFYTIGGVAAVSDAIMRLLGGQNEHNSI